jgi:hypothetical protein
MRRHVLILALGGDVPDDFRGADVHVVAPALNSWLRHWLSDEDAARRRASDRLVSSLDQLRRRGVRAFGSVGDADPLQALADALRTFPADEIVIAEGPERPNRLSHELASRARRQFAQPVVDGGHALPIAA